MNKNLLFAVLVGMVVLILSVMITVVSAGNWTRPTTTATITTLPTDAYNMMIDSWGGNRTIDTEENATVNWTKFLTGDLIPYTQVMGNLALIILVAMPFIGLFLMHQDVVPAAIICMIIGAVMLPFIPSQFTLLAGVFTVIGGVVVVVYRLFKERP